MSTPTDGSGYYRGFAGSGSGPPPAHTSVSRRTAILLVAAVVAVTGVALMTLIDVSRVIYTPGPLYPTLGNGDSPEIITVEGAETYPTTGSLDFTTVVLQGGPRSDVSAWDWLLAEFDSDATVVPEEAVYPEGVTSQQVQEQNAELMANSQQGAAVVALRAAGEEISQDVLVAQVMEGAPAGDALQVNDEIVSVDGDSIADPGEVSQVLQTFDPGSTVPFTIIRDGEEQSIEVPTGEGEGESAGDTIVGVYLAADYELPYEVTIDAGNVGGPSAGLMFSLAVYDLITPEDLTGGEHFAGTGTIARADTGEVGPISGIAQKMVGARDGGADYFLAPADNCDDVTGNIPDGLEVIRAETFEQAKEAVTAIGADPEADVPRC